LAGFEQAMWDYSKIIEIIFHMAPNYIDSARNCKHSETGRVNKSH